MWVEWIQRNLNTYVEGYVIQSSPRCSPVSRHAEANNLACLVYLGDVLLSLLTVLMIYFHGEHRHY